MGEVKRVVGAKCQVTKDGVYFKSGEYVYLSEDDGSGCPWFNSKPGVFGRTAAGSHPLSISRVKFLSGEEEMNQIEAGKLVVITANTNYSRNKVGDVGVTQADVDGGSVRVFVPGNGKMSVWTKHREMEEVKTLVKADLSYKREVIRVQNVDGIDYVITKDSDDGKVNINSLESLTATGWAPESKEVITELTLEQVADKFDIDVKNLRIKE